MPTGEGGGRGAKSYDGKESKKALSSINHSILSGGSGADRIGRRAESLAANRSVGPTLREDNKCFAIYLSSTNMLNMELDLQSLLGSMSRDVHRCSHWLRPRNPPSPLAFGLITSGVIGQLR